jgi:hypothetical protein
VALRRSGFVANAAAARRSVATAPAPLDVVEDIAATVNAHLAPLPHQHHGHTLYALQPGVSFTNPSAEPILLYIHKDVLYLRLPNSRDELFRPSRITDLERALA